MLWGIDGDLTAKDPAAELHCKQLFSFNSGMPNPAMIIAHDYVKGMAFALGDRNHVGICSLDTQKVLETRALPELNKACCATVSRAGHMETFWVCDIYGKVANVDCRAGRGEKPEIVQSHLDSPNVLEVGRGGQRFLVVFGKEMMDRKARVYDIRASKEPCQSFSVDSMQSGVLFPHFDEDTGVCTIAHRNSEEIQAAVLTEEARMKPVSAIKLKEEIVAYSVFPKVVVDVKNVEVMRVATVNKDGNVKVISVIVPKKNVSAPADTRRNRRSCSTTTFSQRLKCTPRSRCTSGRSGARPRERLEKGNSRRGCR